jgi:putative ABC transport system ATP-binding protein
MDPIPNLLEALAVSRKLSAPDERLLLDGISFGVARAEVLAVLGPSGAGKSTLLRLLNRLDEPTGGTVLLSGEDYRRIPPRTLRRRVGMIMQRAYLFPGTVAENVRFGPLQDGRAMTESAVESLLEQVGLAGYSGRDALTLSGGEAQRVAITRALANDPEVLLLDEPTSALDEVAKQGVEALLESVIRKRGLACVWVTHDAAQAGRMADSVLLLEAGRTTSFGPAAEVLSGRIPHELAKNGAASG